MNPVRARARRARNKARGRARKWIRPRAASAWSAITLPATALSLLRDDRIHPAHRMSATAKIRLAHRYWSNTRKVFTGTSYKAHLAMTAKILEAGPEVAGDVVECGCFNGGSTANLSIACKLAGRRLIAYDSFEGLPAPTPGDKYATDQTEGFLAVDLEEVRANVARLGEIDVCEFRKGWFEDTLPSHDTPVVLAFLDVDYQASLRDCILNLWPHLTERGYVFIDEYTLLDYCALFFSERFWRESFDREPPGLVGAGSGVGVGEFYLGPRKDTRAFDGPGSLAYTRKDLSGSWGYFPEDGPGGAIAPDPGSDSDSLA